MQQHGRLWELDAAAAESEGSVDQLGLCRKNECPHNGARAGQKPKP